MFEIGITTLALSVAAFFFIWWIAKDVKTTVVLTALIGVAGALIIASNPSAEYGIKVLNSTATLGKCALFLLPWAAGSFIGYRITVGAAPLPN